MSYYIMLDQPLKLKLTQQHVDHEGKNITDIHGDYLPRGPKKDLILDDSRINLYHVYAESWMCAKPSSQMLTLSTGINRAIPHPLHTCTSSLNLESVV